MSANDPSPESHAERLQNLHAASLRLLGLLNAQQPETTLLQQAIESLAELIGARYGAIDVPDEAGKLAQFVYTGITPEEAEQIGRAPEGRGLLAVPVSHDGRMYGYIYLSEKKDGAPFSAEDEQLVTRFADTLALTIRIHRTAAEMEWPGAERQLRQSEQTRKLSSAIQHTADSVIITDAEGVIEYVNPAFERTTGYTTAEVVGQKPNLVKSGVHDDAFYRRLWETLRAGMPFRDIFINRRKNGDLYFEEKTITPLKDDTGRTTHFVSTGKNITERMQAEIALRESERRYHAMAEISPVGIFRTDTDGKCLYVNRRWCEIAGLTPDAARGDGWSQSLHPEDREQIFAEWSRAVREDRPFQMEYRFRTPDGIVTWVLGQAIAERDDQGHATGYVGTVTDITARRMAEEKSRLQAQIIEQIHDSVVSTDLAGNVTTWNKGAERLFGYTQAEALGRHISFVYPPEEHAFLENNVIAPLKLHGSHEVEVRMRRKSGEDFHANLALSLLREPGGRPIGMIGYSLDITERKWAEEALRDSNALLENVFNNSHLLMAYLDPVLNFIRVNAAYAAAGGHEPDFYVGKNHFALYPNAENEALFRHVVETGEPHFAYAKPFEYPDQPERGATYWDWSLHPVKDQRGEVLGLVFLLLDVTERERAELALRESEERFRSLTELSADWYWEQDANYRFTVITRNEESAERFPTDETLGKTRWELPYLDVPPEVWEEHKHMLAERRPFRDLVLKRRDRNGRVRYSSLNGEPVFDARGDFRGYRGTGRDITERMQAHETLRANEARLAEAQRMAHLGNWDLDFAGNKLTWSDEIYRIFEMDPVKFDASYEAFLDAIHPDDRELVNSAYTESVKNKTPYDIEHRLLMKDGRIKYVHERCETFYDDAGQPLRSVGTVQDITEHKHTEEQLNYLAYYDTLTGLPNRALLLERLRQATADADRVGRLVAVMFLDLDRFKYINDTLGHHAGDGLLKAVAERLQSCVRAGDTIARLGGDEFTIVLSNVAHVDDIARVARKLIDSFARPFAVEGRELFTTTSIGITLYPFDEREAEGLLKNADTAMYHAKERGRNTFQYFTAELNVRAERRLRIETALRHALERNELSLHYQPQVDLKTGRITGMEALARWKHPELGNVSPVEFIPVAEETGLIVPLGEWVLREACRQIKIWHDTGFPKLQVAVNLSGKQLRQKDFPERVREILRETKLGSRYLDLELTESLLMVDTEETAGIMHALHKIGVSFSVDDFGTGYSSLAYLKRFPIDVLKIDRSFVRDIATDPNDVAIVKTVIAMAHTLGMHVIAEGVETREQLEFLRNQGCDGSQGYYCSMPLSAEEFSELLVDWKRIHADRCQRTDQTPRAPRQRRPAKNKPRTRVRRQVRK